MTIRHLQVFIAVADCKTMRAAAEKLYISQPSVSQAVKELEEHYDVKLFERLNQRIYITDSGKKLLSYARHIVASLEECEQELKKDRLHPVLRVGCSVSVGTALMEDYLQSYEKVMPLSDVRVTINNTSEIERQVLSGALDLAIVEGNVESEELVVSQAAEDELFLVVGRVHPFYGQKRISLSQLEGQPLISREEGSMDRNQFEQFLREQNIHMIKKWNCTNVQAILNSVKAGRGIGILSSLLVEKELKSKELQALNVEDIHMRRQIKLIYHKNKFMTEAMNRLIQTIQEKPAAQHHS